MRRWFLVGMACLLPALPAAAQEQQPSTRVAQVDTAHYPDVTLYVQVTDQAGTPVANLTKNDFTITEDGQTVEISSFAGGGAGPIHTVLVIDTSGSMDEAGKMEGARNAASQFVDMMRPGDETAVIAFSSQPRLIQPFTDNTSDLNRSIQSLSPDGSTALYDSLIQGVDTLENVEGRRALLVLTDGRDIVGTDDPRQASNASLEQAIDHAQEQGISVQVVGLGDRGSADLRTGIDQPVLQQIASETGGTYVYTPRADELSALYTAMAGDMQQEYRLTYHSPRPFYDGTRRDIQVNVSGSGTASSGYVEQHLIDVRSSPQVGGFLLLPILLALMLPTLLRRRGKRAAAPQPAPAALSAGGPSCRSCGTALTPPDARFCITCGTNQTAAQPQPAAVAASAGRSFCDQCGRPLRTNARFCANCGEAVPPRVAPRTVVQ